MSELPREVLSWLQRMDLSYAVTNPKRDFSNGFLFAEIIARYHPTLIRMTSFENGLKLATKHDNWEQLGKIFAKIGCAIPKHEYEKVIHCAAGAAVAIIKKVYCFFNKRALDVPPPVQQAVEELPDFARPTATWLLKNPELERIKDGVARIYHAVGILDGHNDDLAYYRYRNASHLIASQRLAFGETKDELEDEDIQPTGNVTELQVKTLRRDLPTLGDRDMLASPQRVKRQTPLRWAKTAVSGLDALPSLQGVFKPCADILKPLIFSLVSDQLDPKEPLAEFVELALRETLDDATCVKVLDLLAQRASLLVDTCLKSPVEMWKLWTLMMPLLSETPDNSPLFESAIIFYKKLGEAMREVEAELTQQLFCGIGLPSLANVMNSAGKREAICAIFSSYIMDNSTSHLSFLRDLKNALAGNIQSNGLYVIVLSYLVHSETFDENVLDLYLYYSIVALQSLQTKVRVAGLSILGTIARDPLPQGRHAILNLIPHIASLVHDKWWEVQAQLCVLTSHILSALPSMKEEVPDKAVETTLGIVEAVFNASQSSATLQVGICSFSHNLEDFPSLLSLFLQVLLKQPDDMRQRLLQDGIPARMAYVIGTSSRLYEEVSIHDVWPAAQVAKCLVGMVAKEEFVGPHFQVLLACCRGTIAGDAWLEAAEAMTNVVASGLVSPHSADAFNVLQAMWEDPEIMTKTLVMFSPAIVDVLGSTTVSTASFWEHLRREGKGGAPAGAELIIKAFQSHYPAEFKEQNFIS